MGKLTEQDREEIKRKYLSGQTSEYIAKQFGVKGQYIRKLAKDNEWKELKLKMPASEIKKLREEIKDSPARQLALLEAKSADNFRKDTPVTREFILDQLRRGVSLHAAAKRAGISGHTLKDWRRKDSDFSDRVEEAQADFVGAIEMLAGGVTTPKEALSLLERHPLTKKVWGKEEDKHTIKIEFAYNRHAQNVIDGEFQSVEDAPQIESQGGN